MVSGDVKQFHRQLGVIPAHKDLFGREATLEELLDLVKLYPVTEWLSFLARMQNMLAAHQLGEREHIQRVLCGTISPVVHEKLKDFEQRIGDRAAFGLYYERQMSTLQQLAVLHAPETGDATFNSDKGRHDLSMALLMTMDIMGLNRQTSASVEAMLSVISQEQIRMSMTSAPEYATRALYFYELNQEAQSAEVTKYLDLFKIATGVDAADCIMGGLVIVIKEAREFDEIANAWQGIPRPHQCDNPKLGEVLAAYEAVRMRSLTGLRDLIAEREGSRPVRDWNLIALSQAPLCDLGDMGVFPLNHTVLGRSLFDSVRHAILTAALDKRLPDPYTNERAVGELYGKVFESYAYSLFREAFPDRVFRIPEVAGEQRADFLIWFPQRVVVVEVKGVHFVGREHASYLTIDERREELTRIGMPNTINQLASTIRAIRAGDLTAPSMPSFDWTMTPIVPVIVTEERMPQVPGCWDAFYEEMSEPFDELTGAGPPSKFRLLNIGDVETIADLESSDDLGAMLVRWGADSTVTELTWGSFLATQDVCYRRRFVPDRYWETMKFLARRLGLDQTQLVRPDYPEGGE